MSVIQLDRFLVAKISEHVVCKAANTKKVRISKLKLKAKVHKSTVSVTFRKYLPDFSVAG